MSGTERAIRWSTIAAVTGVAIVAGWVSYEHALAVVRAHGEAGAVAQVYPVTVDGLIYSASMVLLDAARRGVRAPGLARWLLAAGIGATLAANVAAGLHFGPVGAVVAAWPAAALVGSYELLMLIIRSSAGTAHPVRVPADPAAVPQIVGGDQADDGGADEDQVDEQADDGPQPDAVPAPVPTDAEHAALIALRATLAAGNPLSLNQLQNRFSLTRAQATRTRQLVLAESNGHQADDADGADGKADR
jgi:hypothetical protein